MNLKTRQVDYTQAFPQALLEDPVFMRVPQGWFVKNGKLTQHQNPKHNNLLHYLKRKRNLYGCKQVAWNWFKHLTTGLLKQGFIQSKTDSCLFLRKDCILVVYVDDCLIIAKEDWIIDELIHQLSTQFLLQDEGDVSAFLGVQISKDNITKTITFTQPNLIRQILHDVGLTQTSNSKDTDTPTDSILYDDSFGIEHTESWNY